MNDTDVSAGELYLGICDCSPRLTLTLTLTLALSPTLSLILSLTFDLTPTLTHVIAARRTTCTRTPQQRLQAFVCKVHSPVPDLAGVKTYQ